MRSFFSVGFVPEDQIGRAVELDSYELAGYTLEAFREAKLSGKPFLGFDPAVLTQGKRLGALPSGIKLTVARSRTGNVDFDVVVNPLSWAILSNRLGSALLRVATDQVELLPVEITGVDGQTLRSDFCVANVLQVFDAVSERKSIRSRIKLGKTFPIIKLVLVEEKIPSGAHVFRVSGYHNKFFVDEIAKAALAGQPHDGLAFIRVDTE